MNTFICCDYLIFSKRINRKYKNQQPKANGFRKTCCFKGIVSDIEKFRIARILILKNETLFLKGM